MKISTLTVATHAEILTTEIVFNIDEFFLSIFRCLIFYGMKLQDTYLITYYTRTKQCLIIQEITIQCSMSIIMPIVITQKFADTFIHITLVFLQQFSVLCFVKETHIFEHVLSRSCRRWISKIFHLK